MRALRFSAAVAIAVGLTLLAGDLWLRSITDVPHAVQDVAIHPPRISVVIAQPTAKHTKPHRPARHKPSHTPVELVATQSPAKTGQAAKPAAHPTIQVAQHTVTRTHHVARHTPKPQPVSTPTPKPKPQPVPTPTPTPPTTTPPPTDTPPATPQPPVTPGPLPPTTPGAPEPPVDTPVVPTAPAALAMGPCAAYTSQTRSGAALTVSFDVSVVNCPVSLASYQSTTAGHTNEAYASGVFATGAWSLTVALTCGTDNQADLFVGAPPLVIGGPNANLDLGAWAIFFPCAS